MRLGRMLQLGLARVPFRLGLSGSRRLLQALSATETFHRTVLGPHWYLVAVGTRAERRGQGLGSALVDVGASRADAAGVPCYLETAKESNTDFYARRGFEVIGQTNVDGCMLTGMVREPRQALQESMDEALASITHMDRAGSPIRADHQPPLTGSDATRPYQPHPRARAVGDQGSTRAAP
jgi:GNAT superfamily N-acetyltransferase